MKNEKAVIIAENLCRKYKIMKRDGSWFKYLFSREYSILNAINDVNFKINQGEIVGFLGPNGAGKSTVIKMLCGILLPSAGSVKVLDKDPFKYRKQNSFYIGAVFGQRSQLWWDLPIGDTFSLLKKMYKISESDYKRNLMLYDEYLDLGTIWNQPVRQLSLGQRMRAEIAVSILHNPKILFLDEPTIGLDVVVKRQIRKFIKHMNEERNTTILLTSHDMKDIEVLCERVIIIDKGNILLDENLEKLQLCYNRESHIKVRFSNAVFEPIKIDNTIAECTDDGYTWDIIFDKEKQSYGYVINELLTYGKLCDVSVIEQSVEDIIIDIYENGVAFHNKSFNQ